MYVYVVDVCAALSTAIIGCAQSSMCARFYLRFAPSRYAPPPPPPLLCAALLRLHILYCNFHETVKMIPFCKYVRNSTVILSLYSPLLFNGRVLQDGGWKVNDYACCRHVCEHEDMGTWALVLTKFWQAPKPFSKQGADYANHKLMSSQSFESYKRACAIINCCRI